MDEAVTLPPAGMNAGAHVEQPEHSRTREWRVAGVPRLGQGAWFSCMALIEIPALSSLGSLSGSCGFCELPDSLARNAFHS